MPICRQNQILIVPIFFIFVHNGYNVFSLVSDEWQSQQYFVLLILKNREYRNSKNYVIDR